MQKAGKYVLPMIVSVCNVRIVEEELTAINIQSYRINFLRSADLKHFKKAVHIKEYSMNIKKLNNPKLHPKHVRLLVPAVR